MMRNEMEFRQWDAIVVGAGPAGSFAAYGLARAGASVLLADRAKFPRWKVCGCCLNPEAIAILAKAGLGNIVSQAGALPLGEFRVATRRFHARIPLEGWFALSRERFDCSLVESAQQAGALFLPGTQVRLGTVGTAARTCVLREQLNESSIAASVIIAADGLAGRLMAADTGDSRIQPEARIGAGVTIRNNTGDYDPNIVFMACASGGYVGLARLEDGRLNIAAAFDAPFVRHCGGPGQAAARIIAEVKWPAIAELAAHAWRGTIPLTRSVRRPALDRLLAIGDAAGYVEPFTGEGMAGALASAAAVVRLLKHGWRPALTNVWKNWHQIPAARRRRLIRSLAWGLRRPWLVDTAVGLAGVFPATAGQLVTRLFPCESAAPPQSPYPAQNRELRTAPALAISSVDPK